MIITEKIDEELIAWIKDSYDQNDFCERSLLVDAIHCLDKDEPDVEKALARLLDLTPIAGTKFVCPPDFAVDIENGKL